VDNLYEAFNGPMVTTGSFSPVPTGTALKTLLQIAAPATRDLRLAAWGISFDGTPAGIKTELLQTDVAATVTAHVASGVQPFTDPNAPTSLVTLGTAATGYTATAEGSITATRTFDAQDLTAYSYSYEWPLGHEPRVAPSRFLRVRVLAPATVNALCWVRWKEA
jgi:hypothetical protein